MAMGKFFFLRSYLNGLVLEVENSTAGAKVVTARQKNHNFDQQLFYEDAMTGTVRAKVNSFCMDVTEESLVMTPYQATNSAQQWKIINRQIQSRFDTSLCVDIADFKQEEGATVTVSKFSTAANQLWSVEYTAPPSFFIRNQLHGKVMEVHNADPSPGSRVVINEASEEVALSQLWYEDSKGVIRSKLNHYGLDSADGVLKTMPYDADRPTMQWLCMGSRISNRHDLFMVLDIKADQNRVIPYESSGSQSQNWEKDYLNEFLV